MANSHNTPLSTTSARLLLAQAVCQLGSSDWPAVARLLATSSHLPDQDKRVLNGEICSTVYNKLAGNVTIRVSDTESPNARASRKVARALYVQALQDAYDAVKTRLEQEKKLVTEINAINSGSLDEQLLASVPPAIRARIKKTEPKHEEAPPDNRDQQDDGKAGGDVEMGDMARDQAVKAGNQGDSAVSSANGTPHPKQEEAEPSKSREDTPAAPRRSGRRAGTVDDDSNSVAAAETPQAELEDEGDAPDSEQADEPEEDGSKRRVGRRKGTAVRGSRRGQKRRTSEPTTSPPPAERPAKRVKTDSEQSAADLARFRKAITLLLSRLDDEPSINMFKQAVKKSDAPAYPDAVKRPMWLAQVTSRVKKGITTNEVELMRDMALLCANAIQFNGKDDTVGKEAAELWTKFESMMEEHLSRFRGDND